MVASITYYHVLVLINSLVGALDLIKHLAWYLIK